MKNIFKLAFLALTFSVSNSSFADDCDASCQNTQINAYFKALDKVSLKGSTIEDIDALLMLMHDEVKYVHVEYQANFDKDTWRKAFLRNLKRGAYQDSKNDEMRVLNSIYGKNYTAIEYSHGVIQTDGSWQKTEPLLVLFGFTDGKISLVKELW